jgi:hypothetical protein
MLNKRLQVIGFIAPTSPPEIRSNGMTRVVGVMLPLLIRLAERPLELILHLFVALQRHEI